VKVVASLITRAGGVGPMTIAMLLRIVENRLKPCRRSPDRYD
jgi:5,10-methylene-tetrahydrofolate dehydrogenase/methenyl tetrahydrofolate cyclohydrolase